MNCEFGRSSESWHDAHAMQARGSASDDEERLNVGCGLIRGQELLAAMVVYSTVQYKVFLSCGPGSATWPEMQKIR